MTEFPESWQSSRLSFEPFLESEVELMQGIFESHKNLRHLDPTFIEYSIQQYQDLIAADQTGVQCLRESTFFLRKIVEKSTAEVVGYLQVELNAPSTGWAWVPMLVIIPEKQRLGFGKESVQAMISEINRTISPARIGLNVYASNISAFRFWFEMGFREISSWEIETVGKQRFDCLVLVRGQIDKS